MHFDEILSLIGGFGKFQKILFVWISLPEIFLAFHMLVSVFTGAIPPHLCRSVRPPDNTPTPSGYNFSLLSSPDGRPELSCMAEFNHSAALAGNHSRHTGSCPGGWEYSQETYYSTIVTEWDLVCDKARLNYIASSIYMLGFLVGSVTFGPLADTYGRRPIILFSLTILTVSGVGAAFSPNYYIYISLRFVIGMSTSGVIMIVFVLGAEWTGSKQRMLAGVITSYFYGFGYIMLAGVAYLFRDWRKLQLAISAPGFIFVSYFWLLPKSARWLMANDRYEEAWELIRKAARLNGKTLQEDLELCQGWNDNRKRRKHTGIDLVRTPTMRKQSLVLFYLWFTCYLVYYGVSINISDFGMNIYLTQMIFGLMEMAANILTHFTLKLSRRFSQLAFLAVTGIASLLIAFIPNDLSTIRTVLAMVGKFGVTASLNIVYMFSAEILPTVVSHHMWAVIFLNPEVGD